MTGNVSLGCVIVSLRENSSYEGTYSGRNGTGQRRICHWHRSLRGRHLILPVWSFPSQYEQDERSVNRSLVRLDATLPEKMQQNPIYRVYHEQWPSTAGKSIKDMSCWFEHIYHCTIGRKHLIHRISRRRGSMPLSYWENGKKGMANRAVVTGYKICQSECNRPWYVAEAASRRVVLQYNHQLGIVSLPKRSIIR